MRSLRLSILTALICLMAASAFGSGFSIFEQGAKASGMGGAFAATADDPSAIFYNPAGIAYQRELTFLGGATFINFSNEFQGDPDSDYTAGASGKYDRHTFVPPNMYVTMPIGDNLAVGVGVYAAFGLRTDWQDPWVGRFISRDADLKTTSVNPTIAWKTSSGRFAIGGGLEYRKARVILNANSEAINPFTGRIIDIANVRLVSDYGDDIGWNAGVMLKGEKWRFGATYRSDMDIDLEGEAEVTQITSGNAQLDAIIGSQLPPDQNINTKFPFPAIASVGLAYSPSAKTDVEFDITHMTWSRFEALTVNFETTPQHGFTREQNWEDSSAYRLGVNHKASADWDVRFGILYDVNPQPVEAVSPLLPDSDRMGGSFGFGWHHGPWIADFAGFFLHFKDRDTEGQNPEGFDGVYKTDAILWCTNFGYRF